MPDRPASEPDHGRTPESGKPTVPPQEAPGASSQKAPEGPLEASPLPTRDLESFDPSRQMDRSRITLRVDVGTIGGDGRKGWGEALISQELRDRIVKFWEAAKALDASSVRDFDESMTLHWDDEDTICWDMMFMDVGKQSIQWSGVLDGGEIFETDGIPVHKVIEAEMGADLDFRKDTDEDSAYEG